MDYLLHILILIAIYSILVVSLDLIAGYTGLLSIAHAAFYGIGAYATALLSLHFQTNFLLNMVFGALLSAVVELSAVTLFAVNLACTFLLQAAPQTAPAPVSMLADSA